MSKYSLLIQYLAKTSFICRGASARLPRHDIASTSRTSDCIKVIDNMVPRNNLFRHVAFASKIAAQLRTYFLLSKNSISLHQLSAWWARCCPTATSERMRIQSRADIRFFALREASIKRSQWDNALPTKYDYCQSTYTSTATCFATTKKSNDMSPHRCFRCLLSCFCCGRLQLLPHYCATRLALRQWLLAWRSRWQSYV